MISPQIWMHWRSFAQTLESQTAPDLDAMTQTVAHHLRERGLESDRMDHRLEGTGIPKLPFR